MSKRSAASELTDRNWDQEEEPEEAGEFSKANDDTIKTRQIIKAKRRNVGGTESQDAKMPFTGFGGFSFKPTQTSTPLFGGNKTESKIPVEVKKSAEGEKRHAEKETEEGSPAKMQKTTTNGSDSGSQNLSYLSSLRSLNVSVLNWISQHVEKNPYCILSPIFKDYEKHLSELERDKAKTEANGKGSGELKAEESVKTMDTQEPPKPKTGLTFGMGVLNTAGSIGLGASTAFSGFGSKPSSTAPWPSTTGSATGFSFAVGKSSAEFKPTEGASESQEDDEYVPPKPEVTEHKEEGSVYSKKCKLFYQKDGAWKEKGVGQLHLKKGDNKPQLVVRADTTLGNILLNILLSSAIPLTRSGKNNVSMMCVPNPPIGKDKDNKPIPMLIRVKTAEDADELLEQMKNIQS